MKTLSDEEEEAVQQWSSCQNQSSVSPLFCVADLQPAAGIACGSASILDYRPPQNLLLQVNSLRSHHALGE